MMRAALLGAMAIAVTASAIAQQVPPQTGALAPGGTGLMAGQVVDPEARKSVSGAVVWLLSDGILRPESPRVMTDGEGRFVFTNVPAGRYAFYADKLGYRRGQYGQRSVMADGRELDLAEGQVRSDVDLPIWKNAAIAGTVTDEAGEPVVGVNVRAFRKVWGLGQVNFTSSFQGTIATTDDRGVYRLASLIPGDYVVAVPSTMTTFPSGVMPDLLSQRNALGQASVAIPEISTLGSPNNQRVGSAVIMNGNRAIVPPAPEEEDVTAVYRTTFFPASPTIAEATIVSLRPGEERSGVDVSLKPSQASRVSGQLVGPDGPLGRTAIRVIPAGDSFVSGSPGFETATALSDGNGRFDLLGIPEGHYFLVVETPRTAVLSEAALPLLWASESLTVGGTDVTNVVVSVRRAPRITGHVELRGGRTKIDYVTATIEPINAEGTIGALRIARMEPNLTFAASAAPGRYVLTLDFPPDVPCTAALAQGRDVTDEPLILEDKDVDVTIVCGETPTRLSGTVRGESGTIDSGVRVVAFPVERRYWSGTEVRIRRLRNNTSDEAGHFSISYLPAGEYFVAAIPFDNSDSWRDVKVLDALSRAATRVALGAAESRTVDLRTVRIR